MSTSFEFGCVHCGSNIQTRTPDVVHIEANRKIRTVGNWFDWYNNVRMNVKCSNVIEIIGFIGINQRGISRIGIDTN